MAHRLTHRPVPHGTILDRAFDMLDAPALLSFGTQKVARPHLEQADDDYRFVEQSLERWADRGFSRRGGSLS